MSIKRKLEKASKLILGDGKSETFLDQLSIKGFNEKEFNEIENLLISINQEIDKCKRYPFKEALELSSLMNIFYNLTTLYLLGKKNTEEITLFVNRWAAQIGEICKK